MKKKISSVMLIDDNPDDNYFHTKIIRKVTNLNDIATAENGFKALEMIKMRGANNESLPEIIFLDINMPNMNGWEFLEEYKKLEQNLLSKVIVVMLTTSDNPDDFKEAVKIKTVAEFRTKPLTPDMLGQIIDKYF